MAAREIDLGLFPEAAPSRASSPLRFVDIAVTATAKEFSGIYRNKQYHAPDFLATLGRARAGGVQRIILTGMSVDDVDTNLAIVRQHPDQCSLTVGIHPYHAAIAEQDLPEQIDRLACAVEAVLSREASSLSAFGELGLDYDHLDHASKDEQIRVFRAQLDFIASKQWDLPLFLHCRAAFDDFHEIIRAYLPKLKRSGVVHSFVGSTAEMRALVDLGLHISVNGFSFQDAESLQMVAAVPLDRLHLETDAPWGEVKPSSALYRRYCANLPPLPPAKKRDKWDPEFMVKERNESCNIASVAYVVAGLKRLSVDEIAGAAWRNSTAMFKVGA